MSDDERRGRLAVRHALAPSARVATVEAAVEAMTCLHATEPANVYLSAHARSGATRDDIERALFHERTVVRQLAMRRTVFAFPRDLLPAVWGSASARVAAQLGARLAKEVEAAGLAPDGPAWLREAVRRGAGRAGYGARDHDDAARTDPAARRTPADIAGQELRRRVPGRPARARRRSPPTGSCSGAATTGAGRPHARTGPSPRSGWGRTVTALDERAGYAALVERWLRTFGPGTEADVVWWLGATKGAVRRALTDVSAVEVELADGTPAWLLPDDVDEVAAPEDWAALLPALDPTTMGWKQRDFYLGEHAAKIFDSNGNGGPTMWWNGRIVGGWTQEPRRDRGAGPGRRRCRAGRGRRSRPRRPGSRRGSTVTSCGRSTSPRWPRAHPS